MSDLTANLPNGAAYAWMDADDYDCETGVLVRASLCPLFESATSWKVLAETLALRCYALAIRDGRLVVRETRIGE